MATDRQYLISLYDLYASLLTEKQKGYFEDYYLFDLSISEIASNYEISRNGVFDQLKRVEANLLDYEAKLNLYNKIKRLEDLKEFNLENVLNIIKE